MAYQILESNKWKVQKNCANTVLVENENLPTYYCDVLGIINNIMDLWIFTFGTNYLHGTFSALQVSSTQYRISLWNRKTILKMGPISTLVVSYRYTSSVASTETFHLFYCLLFATLLHTTFDKSFLLNLNSHTTLA